jgi:undecaprenyl-diphosphatase
VVCVIPAAILQLKSRIRNAPLRRVLCVAMAAFTAFMVVGRLISGVHWVTDIIGGLLLGAGLVILYQAAATRVSIKNKTESK